MQGRLAAVQQNRQPVSLYLPYKREQLLEIDVYAGFAVEAIPFYLVAAVFAVSAREIAVWGHLNFNGESVSLEELFVQEHAL